MTCFWRGVDLKMSWTSRRMSVASGRAAIVHGGSMHEDGREKSASFEKEGIGKNGRSRDGTQGASVVVRVRERRERRRRVRVNRGE